MAVHHAENYADGAFEPGKQPDFRLLRRTALHPKPSKRTGEIKHRYQCSKRTSHGCKKWFVVVERPLEGSLYPALGDKEFLLYTDGEQHDHGTWCGKQVTGELVERTKILAMQMTPRQLRAQLEREGMVLSRRTFAQMKGVRYRYIAKQYGAASDANTVAEIYRLIVDHGQHLHRRGLEDQPNQLMTTRIGCPLRSQNMHESIAKLESFDLETQLNL